MEPIPSLLPDGLLVELELCVYLHNFVNIDLHNQGWYAIRVRPVAEGSWIELPVFGVSHNETVDKPPSGEMWMLEDENRAFRSRLIRVKYCLEEAALGHAVCFHLLHPLHEGLDGIACTVEFELLFFLADITRTTPCPKPHQLKPVARETVRIAGVHRGVHEYCDITFDQDHFALCNATVHSRLVSITAAAGLEGHQSSPTKKTTPYESIRSSSFTLASRASNRSSFSTKRVGDSDEASTALKDSLMRFLTPEDCIDDDFIAQVQTLYATATGILARSSEFTNLWLGNLPKSCFSPLTLDKLRKLVRNQSEDLDADSAASEPRSFAERAGMPTRFKPVGSNPSAACNFDVSADGSSVTNPQTMLSAPPALNSEPPPIYTAPADGSHFAPPSPLDFWQALPEPYSAAVAVSRLLCVWDLCLRGMRADWALLTWLLQHSSAAEMVKALKGKWEARQLLECSHWLVHSGSPGGEEVSYTPAHMPTPSTPWRMSLNCKSEVGHVRNSLKTGTNIIVPRVHKPAIWDYPHRNPLLVVDSSLASHLPEAPASRCLKDANGKDGPADAKECWVAVFVHGFQGAATDLCLVKAQMQLMWPKLEVLSSKANEDKTFDSIENMGQRLAKEMADFLKPYANSYRRPLGRIIVVGHSIGNLIIRAALTCAEMQPYLKNLWLYISISGPHLGWVYNNNKLMDTGVGLLRRLSGGKSLSELTFTDHKNMKDCYLYKLAHTAGFRLFPYVIVMSSPQDKYIPLHSAQVAMCDAACKDVKKGGHYAEMINAIMEGIGQPGATQLFRVDVEFRYRKTEKLRFGTWLGRTAHIDFIETDMYVKFLLWGILWRHKLMPEATSTWVS